MYLNMFSVRVVGGSEREGGYVVLQNGQKYSLQLRNDRPVRCDARVEVSGKHVGTFRLAAHSSFNLERPAHDEGQFTFYLTGSLEGQRIGIDPQNAANGLISVTFSPEHYRQPTVSYSAYASINATTAKSLDTPTASMPSYAQGDTGLSGHSDQKFVPVAEIEYDLSQQTTINLRLVGNDDSPRPLTQITTPVPPFIG